MHRQFIQTSIVLIVLSSVSVVSASDQIDEDNRPSIRVSHKRRQMSVEQAVSLPPAEDSATIARRKERRRKLDTIKEITDTTGTIAALTWWIPGVNLVTGTLHLAASAGRGTVETLAAVDNANETGDSSYLGDAALGIVRTALAFSHVESVVDNAFLTAGPDTAPEPEDFFSKSYKQLKQLNSATGVIESAAVDSLKKVAKNKRNQKIAQKKSELAASYLKKLKDLESLHEQ